MENGRTKGRFDVLLGYAKQDDGVALGTVMAISAILFLLATTLVMLASQQQVSAGSQVARTKALHAADAGISAYLYDLSSDMTYASIHPSLSGTTADGTWSVTAVRVGSGPVTLTSIGTAPGAIRKVIASVQAPTFADYTLLFNESVNIGAAALIKGNVRSNANIANAGEITGQAIAVGTVSGSGKFDGGRFPGSKQQSFATVDYGTLMATATASGTYWPDAGTYGSPAAHYLGYDVILSGGGGTVQKVKGYNSTTGTMTLDPAVQTFTVPASGVLYFDDAIWVHGTFASRLTIACGQDYEDSSGSQLPGPTTVSGAWTNPSSGSNAGKQLVNSTVFIDDNLQPDDITSDHVCGIVSKGDISIADCAADAQNNEIVTAALLSTAGAIHADWITNVHRNHFQLNGSISQWQAGYFLSGSSTGYLSRDYWFDSRLYNSPPPLFPPLGDGTLKVNSWVEN